MTLMGGPIDTRVNPTAVNELAQEHDIEWFRRNVVMKVPYPHPGVMMPAYSAASAGIRPCSIR